MAVFANEEDLEEFLSRPTPADMECVARLDGDFVLLGAGGKMGPTLAMRIRRACDQAGRSTRVIAVSRFSDASAAQRLHAAGVEIETLDLLEETARLPQAPNVIYLAGRKFGSSGQAGLTWIMNVVLPERIARLYRDSRIAVLSSGNIYSLCCPASAGASEDTPPGPIGEYAQTVLGRERVFEHHRANSIILRLNYAVEPRYGVLVDIANKIIAAETVPLEMGYVNVIWQGDANSYVLRSLEHVSVEAPKLNITGPEILRVRDVAARFGELFGKAVSFSGSEAPTALLNNAARCVELLGPPQVSAARAMELVASWLATGGRQLRKPTHFEARDGKF
jgi:nucleoside-diphosphate-sugar epimerase